MSITGLATHDMPDNDGRGAPEKQERDDGTSRPGRETPDQVLNAIREAATPDDMAAVAKDPPPNSPDAAEKQVAQGAYKKRPAELKGCDDGRPEAKVRAHAKTLSEAEGAGATTLD